jgi:hypothetical protein
VKKLTALSLILLFPSFASGAEKRPMPTTVKECVQERRKGVPGFMPKGVTEYNLNEYKNSQELCRKSELTLVDKGHCKDTLGFLLDSAKDLNAFVHQSCEYMMTALPASDPKSQSCRLAQKNFRENGGPAPTQEQCTAAALEAYKNLGSIIEQFHFKLGEFKKLLLEASSRGYLTGQSVAGNIRTIDADKANGVNPDAPHPAARELGAQSIRDFQNKNAETNIQVADSLLQMMGGFKKQGANRYKDVSDDNYSTYQAKIEESWQQLRAKEKNRSAMGEQAKVFLNTEEVLLATDLYLNDMNKAANKAAVFEKVAEARAANYTSLPAQLPFSAPEGSRYGEQASGTGDANPVRAVSKNRVSELSESEGPLAEKKAAPAETQSLDPGEKAAAEKSSTSASRMRGSPSLRDSLKAKLAQKTGGNRSPASQAPSESAAQASGQRDDSSTLPADGSIPAAFGNLQEQTTMGISDGQIKGEGFALGTAKTDQAVKAMLQELSHSGENAEQSDYIGGTESESLFVRVKDFHGRCLKKGCVIQLSHRGM